MSRMESASEASMEEILASIRKIIADEPPSAASPAQAAPASPAPSAAAAAAIQLPSARDALAGNAASPSGAPPFMRQRAAPAPAASQSDAPAPAPFIPGPAARSRAEAIDDDLAGLIDMPAAEPVPAKTQETVSPVEAAREKWSSLINPAPASAPTAAAVSVAPAPSPAPAAAAAPAPVPGIFAPRKGGFYPPQSPAPAPAAAPSPAPAADMAPAPARTSGPVAPAAVADPMGAKIDALAADNASAAAAAALDALVAGLSKTSAVPEKPLATEPAKPVTGASPPAETLVSAALAAQQPKPAHVVTASPAGPLATPAAAPGAPAAAPAARTLEDVVADMIRPMLEKWMTENMPKIVERALKLDASGPPKTGG